MRRPQTDAGPPPEGTGLWVGADETDFGLPRAGDDGVSQWIYFDGGKSE